MLTVVRRSGIIPRLSYDFLNRTSIGRAVRQFNKYRNYVGGYVNHSPIVLLRRDRRTLFQSTRNFCPGIGSTSELELSIGQYEKICNETLDSLTEYFEELVEAAAHLPDADVTYGDGVLTVTFGHPHGTYVINRQTPNKQIWLSSPKSGPKRYDFRDGRWIYRHDGKTLHELLNHEIPAIIINQACFDKCSFSGREKQAVIDSLYPDNKYQ